MDTSLLPFAYLIPLGLLLAGLGALPSRDLREAALAASIVAIACAVAYLGFGFAFQFGGVGLGPASPAGLTGLDAAWSPFPASAGRWTFLGLEGFFLDAQGDPASLSLVRTLALHRLPLAIAAGLIPIMALGRQVHPAGRIAAGIVAAAVVFPMAGAWLWGDGWMATLGLNLNLGHGAIDAAGSGVNFLAAASVAIVAASRLAPQRAGDGAPLAVPRYPQPLLAIGGALLFGAGAAAWFVSDPLLGNRAATSLDGVAITGLISAAASTIMAVAYMWLATGRVMASAAVRGWLAGWAAAGACAPFIPPGSAILVGLIGGLLAIAATYLVASRLRTGDASGFIGTFISAGAWGLLSLGLFADGAFGAGWNGVTAGQGVRGLLWGDAGQLTAQLAALAGIGFLAVCAAWLLLWPVTLAARRFSFGAGRPTGEAEAVSAMPPAAATDAD